MGSALFGLAYFLLLLYWADFFYLIDGSNRSLFVKFRRPLNFFFAILATLSITFLIVAWVVQITGRDLEILDMVVAGFLSFLALVVAIGFLYYGIQMYLTLRKYRSLATYFQKTIADSKDCCGNIWLHSMFCGKVLPCNIFYLFFNPCLQSKSKWTVVSCSPLLSCF